ncbi:MAG TPA: hypothetical protein VL943_06615 [Niabella sp.]|nr:hypothetical protein [Niabella sp.]
MEHQLVAYYRLELATSHQQQVEEWMAESACHQKIYEHTIRIWKESRIDLSSLSYCKEHAWRRLQQVIHQLL